MRHNDEYDYEDKSVRVAVALSRAVALSEELQATVLELASTLRSSGEAAGLEQPSSGETQE